MPSGLIFIRRQGMNRPVGVPQWSSPPAAYNGRVGLVLLCPITTQQKGYPLAPQEEMRENSATIQSALDLSPCIACLGQCTRETTGATHTHIRLPRLPPTVRHKRSAPSRSLRIIAAHNPTGACAQHSQDNTTGAGVAPQPGQLWDALFQATVLLRLADLEGACRLARGDRYAGIWVMSGYCQVQRVALPQS
jgi:hypothetical protein